MVKQVDKNLKHDLSDNQSVEDVDYSENILVFHFDTSWLLIKVALNLVKDACEEIDTGNLIVRGVWLLNHGKDKHGVGKSKTSN